MLNWPIGNRTLRHRTQAPRPPTYIPNYEDSCSQRRIFISKELYVEEPLPGGLSRHGHLLNHQLIPLSLYLMLGPEARDQAPQHKYKEKGIIT